MTTNTTASAATAGPRHTISRIARGLPFVAAATLLPLVTTAPAYAASNTICVGNPSGGCDAHAASISAAVLTANSNGVDDLILVGAGTYADGPYFLDSDVSMKGSGQGVTILTLPASANDDEYLTANGGDVSDLTVKMAAAESGNDAGLVLRPGSTAFRVSVDGAGTLAATGIESEDAIITQSVVHMPVTPGSSSRGVFSEGGTIVADSVIAGHLAYGASSSSTADTVSRVKIKASGSGVATDVGTVNVDNVLIDLGSSDGTGLLAANFNANPIAKSINASHVTVVGGGDNSRGAFAYAANPNALQVSTIQLQNSIIRGPETALAVMAGNNGSVGGNSTATITASYSNWASKSEVPMANGTAQVVQGPGNLNVDPAFVNAAGGNYALKTSSPVVDKGDPIAGGPAMDLVRKNRINDGNGDGSAVRDMGAYEMYDTVAPQTRFTVKPAKTVTTRTVTFKFKSSESGSTFKCKLDKGAWRSCTSPKKLQVKVGKHVFKVRAKDAAGNTDATPAVYRFKRVAR